MAHSWREGSRRLAAGCAALLAGAALEAGAISLGEPRVRSSLGEPLDLRIPVTLDAGESIEPRCFKLLAAPSTDVPRVTGARISVMRSAAGTQLRVQSPAALDAPAFAVGIVAACSGQRAEVRRDYSLLLDPPSAARHSPGIAAPAAATPSLRAIAATLIARIGDTLESIAHAIFPDNRAIRNSYIEALRDTNPRLATLQDNEPIPVDTPVALPDLRTFAHARHAAPRAEQAGSAGAPAEKAAPVRTAAPGAGPELPDTTVREAPKRAARKAAVKPPTQEVPAAVAGAPPRPAASAPPARPAAERHARSDRNFVLKLSSPEMDLSPSRGIDDRMRAQLRERQMILDADDQVAAVLALRHSVKQLETRVAELQLKLAGMPSSFPPPKPPAAAPAPAPAAVASAPATLPAPAAPAPATLPAPATPAPATPPAPGTPAPATPPAPAPPASAAPPAPAPASATPPAPAPMPTSPAAVTAPSSTPAVTPPPTPDKGGKASDKALPRPPSGYRTVTDEEWMRYGLWLLAVALLFAAALLAWRLIQRRRARVLYADHEEEAAPTPALENEPIVVADDAAPVAHPEPRLEVAPDGRRIIDADVHLETRLGDDRDDLRRRYIEERFPEITKGAIVLDDTASVVKGARLFYEDGAIARAVELLQLAIERKPSEVRTWLALFEIFRLERLTGEFDGLARRFKEHHGASTFWPKVQYFGREIDPGNALYQPPPIDKFETIGPAQAKRIAADATFDPIAENWLGAPMDFQNEVLANELRKAIMHEAGIAEPDLVANPMPALRNIEMFTVA